MFVCDNAALISSTSTEIWIKYWVFSSARVTFFKYTSRFDESQAKGQLSFWAGWENVSWTPFWRWPRSRGEEPGERSLCLGWGASSWAAGSSGFFVPIDCSVFGRRENNSSSSAMRHNLFQPHNSSHQHINHNLHSHHPHTALCLLGLQGHLCCPPLHPPGIHKILQQFQIVWSHSNLSSSLRNFHITVDTEFYICCVVKIGLFLSYSI